MQRKGRAGRVQKGFGRGLIGRHLGPPEKGENMMEREERNPDWLDVAHFIPLPWFQTE